MKPLATKQYAGTRHLLNPQRAYVTAAATDVAATFARIRAEQAKAAAANKPTVLRFKGNAK